MNYIYFAENQEVLRNLPSESVDLIYIDPPFNTGREQNRIVLEASRDENGNHKGFKGTTYSTRKVSEFSYSDKFKDYKKFIVPRLQEAHRVLKPTGCLYFHIDYREVHYCKLYLDDIFGRENFLNEIIWAYDYGAKPKNRWPAKHENILYYVKDHKSYTFHIEDDDREQYLAPALVGPEKAELGKLPTDVWWHTIVGTKSSERTGYPSQKPMTIINRIIRTSSNPGDTVLDFFAGSGTVGESCILLNRQFILVDNNPKAIEVMKHRFAKFDKIEWVNI